MLMQYQLNVESTHIPPTPVHLKKPAGGRISTPKYRASLDYAAEFDGLPQDVNRYDLLLLVKRAGRAAGFSQGMINLLDYYMAYTREIDWTEGHSPIVFQSVQNTAMDLGLSERQIRNLENQLFDIRAITWQDSGNHRRYGERCKETGALLYAYGVDLTPLAALKSELEAKLAEKARHDKEWKEIKRQISWYRRQIKAGLAELEMIESTAVPALTQQYDEIFLSIRAHMSLEKLYDLLESHRSLYDEIFLSFEADNICEKKCGLSHKISPMEETDFPRIESTTYKQIDKSITSSDKRISFQEKRSQSSGPNFQTPVQTERAEPETIPESAGLQHITLKQVLNAASPRFKAYIPMEQRAMNWNDIVEAAYKLKETHHITDRTWGRACQALTRNGAAICLLLTDQGLDREVNRVREPYKYFNGMVTRALSGELHLQKSVMGILKREMEVC